MVRVLMIDDDKAVADTVKEHAEETIQEIDFQIEVDFDNAVLRLREMKPDVVVLDVFRGPIVQGDAAGEVVWNDIWGERFCPIIVFSAGDFQFAQPIPEEHPFVKVESKGAGSEELVVQHIEAFAPHIEALNGVEAEIARVTHRVLRDVALYVFREEREPNARRDILVRSVRRYVAAMMDERLVTSDEPLHSWEQFLVPPIGESPLMGDVLRRVNHAEEDPNSYCVLLTPSCDMVADRSKVDRVLVAKCTEPIVFLTRGAELPVNAKSSKIRDRLPILLTRAHCNGYVLLPECPGRQPLMTLDLRALDLLPRDVIGRSGDLDIEYERVASIDSPFREQIAWAYLQVGGRPGLPDRDFSTSVESIVEYCDEQRKQNKK